MAEWFDERCKQLLNDLNQVENNEDANELRLKLIRVAMRDSSLEMFRRAATNSRAMLQESGEDISSVTIEQVEKNLLENIAPTMTADDILPDLAKIPGIPEAMAKAEERFRNEKSDIASEVSADPEPPVESKPLSASDLNLDKFLKKPADKSAPEESSEAKAKSTPSFQDFSNDEPVQPSPDARIKIKNSILRRRD